MHLVMYILVNKDIEMSRGKGMGQVGHAVGTFHYRGNYTQEIMDAYMGGIQKKIILACPQKKLEELEKLEKEKGYIPIRDKGITELEFNTLTCVNLGIFDKDNPDSLPKFVKRLQLY